MHCVKLAVAVCTVENLLSPCVLWNTYWHFGFQCTVETYSHRVYRQQTYDIVCNVKNLRSTCVPSINILHNVYCRQLTDIVGFNVPWKTYGHYVYCGKLTDIVCTVENLLSPCVPWKIFWHRVYRKKLTYIVCTVENLLKSCLLWQIY